MLFLVWSWILRSWYSCYWGGVLCFFQYFPNGSFLSLCYCDLKFPWENLETWLRRVDLIVHHCKVVWISKSDCHHIRFKWYKHSIILLLSYSHKQLRIILVKFWLQCLELFKLLWSPFCWTLNKSISIDISHKFLSHFKFAFWVPKTDWSFLLIIDWKISGLLKSNYGMRIVL